MYLKYYILKSQFLPMWVEGHLLDWNSSMFPFCSALIFDPESIKLWVWEFNFDVLQRFHTLVFGNTRPDRYAVLQHREIVWKKESL